MAGHRPIAIDELYVEITRSLSTEVQEIEESVEIAANMVTKELLSDIREDSPVRTGAYKKGWRRKKLKHSYVVYNSKKPEITYVLERGHLKRGGNGRVSPIPHIEPNEKRAANKFEDMCVKIVAEGVRFSNDT